MPAAGDHGGGDSAALLQCPQGRTPMVSYNKKLSLEARPMDFNFFFFFLLFWGEHISELKLIAGTLFIVPKSSVLKRAWPVKRAFR